MSGAHTDKDVRDLLVELERIGWTVAPSRGGNAHSWGALLCSGGCRITVYSTPKGPQGEQVKVLRRKAQRCPHGHGPARRK